MSTTRIDDKLSAQKQNFSASSKFIGQIMDIQTIKNELSFYTGSFPALAVKAAIEQQEPITPVLLAALKNAAEAPQAIIDMPEYMLPTFALYLLAQFQEQAAYPLVIDLFSTSDEALVDTFGDFVTEDLGRVLASVCGDNIEPIKAIIESPAIEQFIRSACLNALVVLYIEGRLARECIVEYFLALYRGKLETEYSAVWDSLICESCNIYPEEFMPEIKQAFDRNLIDPMSIRLEVVARELNQDKNLVLSDTAQTCKGLITDTHAELENWPCFKASDDSWASFMNAFKTDKETTSSKKKKIGRNEPCPCESGKKYKRCCLQLNIIE